MQLGLPKLRKMTRPNPTEARNFFVALVAWTRSWPSSFVDRSCQLSPRSASCRIPNPLCLLVRRTTSACLTRTHLPILSWSLTFFRLQSGQNSVSLPPLNPPLVRSTSPLCVAPALFNCLGPKTALLLQRLTFTAPHSLLRSFFSVSPSRAPLTPLCTPLPDSLTSRQQQ